MLRSPHLLALALLVLSASGCSLSKFFVRDKTSQPSAPAEPTAQERRDTYVNAHPSLPDPVRAAILRGALARGMSGEQVIASVGQPHSREILIPQAPKTGDVKWVYQQVAFGKHTEYGDGRGEPVVTRTFAGVRDTSIRFWEDAIIGVDDSGIITRAQVVHQCEAARLRGDHDADICRRLRSLDNLAASEPPT
ncbi:MAG: hypothetical protein ACRBN8_02785 [Nannocystales bacterium]